MDALTINRGAPAALSPIAPNTSRGTTGALPCLRSPRLDHPGEPRSSFGTTAAAPNSVNRALTRNRRSRTRVENDDYAAFARRIVAAHGRRIAAGDVERLRDLVALAEEVDHATSVAVAGLRRVGYSWAEIANRLGITRQAAQQRWGNTAVA